MPLTSAIHVFVYGTLKPGEINHHVCERYVIDSQPAIALGKLYHLPFGYPAMTLEGTEVIHGFALTFENKKILNILDEFEQHDPEMFYRIAPGESLAANQYKRQRIKILIPKPSSIDTAWGYVMRLEQIHRLTGVPVTSEHWSRKKPD